MPRETAPRAMLRLSHPGQDPPPLKLLALARASLSTLAPAVLALTAATVTTDARADVSGRFARLSRFHAEVSAAKGPLAYAALRRIWQEWDQGDPGEVEEVL